MLPHTAPPPVWLTYPLPFAQKDAQLQLAANSLVAAPAAVAAARTATTTAVIVATLNTISLSAEVEISAPLSL